MQSGSNDSLYKSAPSNEDDDLIKDNEEYPPYMRLKRPKYLAGTSDSLISDDEDELIRSDMETRLSTSFLTNFTQKLNSNLLRALNLRPFSSQSEYLDHSGSHRNCRVSVKILGFEIIEHQRKFIVSSVSCH